MVPKVRRSEIETNIIIINCRLRPQSFGMTIHTIARQHIVEISYFTQNTAWLARGGFVEDKLSPVIQRNVEKLGLRDSHEKFGSYLLDGHSGFFYTGHFDGGSYIMRREREKISEWNASTAR